MILLFNKILLILFLLLKTASVLHRRNQELPPHSLGVSVFMKSFNNHQTHEAVVGSMAQAMTQVTLDLRCKLPTIAFFYLARHKE